MHGAARSRMACWCRRMEVRKYGVLDSQRCCALLALHGRGHFCMVALAVPARAFADTPAIVYDGNARQLTVSGRRAPWEPDLFQPLKI